MTEHPFKDTGPRDGFHIFPHELGSMEISLHVGLYVEGQLEFDSALGAASVEVMACQDPAPANYAERNRAWLVAEAICRYMNTGGSWSELADIVSKLQICIPHQVEREGWHLFDTYADVNGTPTHVFLNDETGEVVRWVEGKFVDTGLTLDDLQRELEEEDAEEDDESEVSNPGVRACPLQCGRDNCRSDEAAPGDSPKVS